MPYATRNMVLLLCRATEINTLVYYSPQQAYLYVVIISAPHIKSARGDCKKYGDLVGKPAYDRSLPARGKPHCKNYDEDTNIPTPSRHLGGWPFTSPNGGLSDTVSGQIHHPV